jgi:hypothetical protein
MSSPRLLGSVFLLAVTAAGCAQMRQNLRGQELSYRGAWFCAEAGCAEKAMTRSTRGTREDGVDIATVKLQPRAALAFTAEAPFDRMVASVRDCKGKSLQLPDDAIRPAGSHEVGDASARESWVIVLDEPSLRGQLKLGKGECARWMVEVTATWSDGAAFSSRAGITVEK